MNTINFCLTLHLLIVIFSVKICESEDNETKVRLQQGVLSGIISQTLLKKQEYYSFKGIPFAEPPLGELRFMPPKEHTGWDGILPVKIEKPTCMQFNSRMRNNEPYGVSGTEDCLYINVFTPSLDGSYPIVVFDYNDNFRTGFNGTKTYSPEFFLEENVIVVTIGHRLGLFGYLTTEDDVIPANAGLKDFILGLKWIQNNIKAFGGDPDRVTLMGSRGGAALFDMLLYSPKAKGLFTGAILQSGTAFEPAFFYKEPRKTAFKFGEHLGINTSESQALLAELQKIDATTLIVNDYIVTDNDEIEKYQTSVYPLAPTIEYDNPDAVLTSLPEDAKIVNDVPVLIGLNSREGLDIASQFLFEPKLVRDMNQDILFYFPIRTDFRFDSNSSIYEKAIREISEVYFEIGYFSYVNILEYTVYIADVLQNFALDFAANKLSKDMQSPVYYYMFDFRGLLNENSEFLAKRVRNTMQHWGASIGDELCYLHLCSRIRRNYVELTHLPSAQKEIRVLKKMVRLWTNFIKTGNPTPKQDDEILKDFIWQPMDKTNGDKKYLHITKKLDMAVNPLGNRTKFWENFLRKYSEMAVDGVVGDRDEARDEL